MNMTLYCSLWKFGKTSSHILVKFLLISTFVTKETYSISLLEDGPVVSLKDGEISGTSEKVSGGKKVECFLAIPFAEAPVGELRFAAPKPPKPWSGVRNGTVYAPKCPRGVTFPPSKGVSSTEITSEDCLYLNVFRPAETTSHHRLPVMVWIHGGGFCRGSGIIYDGSVLSSHNEVIVVTINYRLCLLGFLNIPGTELKGNYGMLDQVQALKWVQENIASFGGNPSRVTIFGESAGGASVGLHILSPLSKGLFQNAIIQSGFPSGSYASYTTQNKNKFSIFLERLGCTEKEQLLSCLRSRRTEDFVNAQGIWDFLLIAAELPTITVDGVFLLDDPEVDLAKGRLNRFNSAMLGVNKDEGGFFQHGVQPFGNHIPPSFDAFNSSVHKVFFTQNGECDLVKKAILHKYTNYTDPTNPQNVLKNWANLMSDTSFFAPAVATAKSFTKAGISTYFYQFSHRSKFSTFPPEVGVVHFDEIQYVFGVPWKENPSILSSTDYTDEERRLSSVVMKLWTNHAKYGTPNKVESASNHVAWPMYTTERREYLDIGLVMSVRNTFHEDRVAFWNEFVPELKKYCKNKEERAADSWSKQEL